MFGAKALRLVKVEPATARRCGKPRRVISLRLSPGAGCIVSPPPLSSRPMNLHSISFRVLISFRSISPLPSELRFSLSHGNEWTRFDEHSLRFTEGEREGALCRIAAKATLSVNQEFSIAIFSRKRDATIPFPEFSFASVYKIFRVTTCILDCIILSESNCVYSF